VKSFAVGWMAAGRRQASPRPPHCESQWAVPCSDLQGRTAFPGAAAPFICRAAWAAADLFPSVPKHAGPVPLLSRRGYKKTMSLKSAQAKTCRAALLARTQTPIMVWIPFPAPPRRRRSLDGSNQALPYPTGNPLSILSDHRLPPPRGGSAVPDTGSHAAL